MDIIYYRDKKGKTRIGYLVKKVKEYYLILHKSKDYDYEEYVKVKERDIINIKRD